MSRLFCVCSTANGTAWCESRHLSDFSVVLDTASYVSSVLDNYDRVADKGFIRQYYGILVCATSPRRLRADSLARSRKPVDPSILREPALAHELVTANSATRPWCRNPQIALGTIYLVFVLGIGVVRWRRAEASYEYIRRVPRSRCGVAGLMGRARLRPHRCRGVNGRALGSTCRMFKSVMDLIDRDLRVRATGREEPPKGGAQEGRVRARVVDLAQRLLAAEGVELDSLDAKGAGARHETVRHTEEATAPH